MEHLFTTNEVNNLPEKPNKYMNRQSQTIDLTYINGEYALMHPDYHVGDSPFKARWILRQLIERRVQPSTICEVGCGAGAILQELQRNDYLSSASFVGYDISPDAIAKAMSRRGHNLDFYCQDVLEIPFEKPFDLMVSMDVFEHVPDHFGWLERLSTKAHTFVFGIPLDITVLNVLRAKPIMKAWNKLGHIHHFNAETAIATLERSGYEIIEVRFTPGDVVNPKSWKARIASIPRRIGFNLLPDLTVRILGGYSLLVLARPKKSV